MIIIVEGIDRIGKTTLCNKISEVTKIPIHKYNGIIPYSEMKNKQETDKMLSLIQLVEETKTDIIFDRFHLTDCVYGIVERGYKVGKALKNVRLINERLQQYAEAGNTVCVLLMRPTSLMKSSEEHGTDLSYHNQMFDEIWRNYFTRGALKSSIVASKIYTYGLNYNQIPGAVESMRMKKLLEDEERRRTNE